MGVVYRAHDTLLERVVALKIISTSIEANPELRERFFREARAAGQLSHRNIITIHDLGEHEGQPYLAMEFLTGEDLQHRLSRQEPMSLRRKLEVASEMCDGLSYAHRRGLVHRDVKPANIFITDEGIVKLLDFGLARMVASELTRSNMMMGTLNYMAPEQVRGERTDHRADIFSFGVVLYEMLSGRKAFQGDSFATTLYKILQDVPEPLLNIDPTLPPELVWLVEKTLAKPKDERYQDLTEVTRDLAIIRQHLSGSETSPMGAIGLPSTRPPSDAPRTPSTPGSRPGSSGSRPMARGSDAGTTMAATPVPADRAPSGAEPARRSRAPFAVAAIALVAVLGVTAWWMLQSDGVGEPPQQQQPQPSTAAPAAPDPRPAPPAPQALPPPPSEPERAAPTGGDDDSSRAQARIAEDARVRMTRAKAAAREAGGSAIRSAAYSAALAAEREGNRLYRGRDYAEATARFNEASGLFRGAELGAATAAPAPAPAQVEERPQSAQQPPRPETEKPTAPPPAQPPPAVPTGEGQVQLPAGTVPRVPTTAQPQTKQAPQSAAEGASSPASSENAVREVLRRYQRAMEGRNLDALKAIWPTLQGAQEEAVRREFQFARRIELEVDDPDITVSGASAAAVFVRRYRIVTTDNQKLDRSSRTTMTLRRTGNDWLIDRVRFEPIR